MIDKLRKMLKNHPKIKKMCSVIYRSIFLPVFSGRAFYNLYYVIFQKRQELEKIAKLGYTNIRPFMNSNWRIGTESDKVFRRYYLADKDDLKCFIKIATFNDSTVKNEITVQSRLGNKLLNKTPRLIYSSFEFDEKHCILINEFVQGLVPFYDYYKANNIELYKKINEILDSLFSINLIHADIHPGNVMVDKSGNLILLDFGISKFINLENGVDYLARPGTFYREDDGVRKYDDAYSFLQMLEKIGYTNVDNLPAEYLLLQERINKLFFVVKL